jgi:hypothetical protein
VCPFPTGALSPSPPQSPLILNSMLANSKINHDGLLCADPLCRTVNGVDMKLEHGNKMVKAADEGPARCQFSPGPNLNTPNSEPPPSNLDPGSSVTNESGPRTPDPESTSCQVCGPPSGPPSQTGRLMNPFPEPKTTSWEFVAPAKFLGNRRAAYGGQLTFRHGFFEYDAAGEDMVGGFDVTLASEAYDLEIGMTHVVPAWSFKWEYPFSSSSLFSSSLSQRPFSGFPISHSFASPLLQILLQLDKPPQPDHLRDPKNRRIETR